MRSLLFCFVALVAVATAAKSSASTEKLLELTDETLQDALNEHKLMLISIGVDGCEPCALYEKRMKQAQKEIRVKSTGSVTLAKLTITSQDSPVIGNIVQGQLSLPKLLIFRDGEVRHTTKNGSRTKHARTRTHTHARTHGRTHARMHSRTHARTQPLSHSLTQSLSRSVTQSLTHSVAHSVNQ